MSSLEPAEPTTSLPSEMVTRCVPAVEKRSFRPLTIVNEPAPALLILLPSANEELLPISVMVLFPRPVHVKVPAPGVSLRSLIVAPALSLMMPVVASMRVMIPPPSRVRVLLPTATPLVRVSVRPLSTSMTAVVGSAANVVIVVEASTSR